MNLQINENIKAWWTKLPNELKGRFPTFVHKLDPNAEILFVGFNPAGSIISPPKKIEDLTSQIMEEIIEEEKKLIGLWSPDEKFYKRYYSIFHRIKNDLKVSCEYVDIFQAKCSESDKLIKLMSDKNGFLESHKNHLQNFELIINELPSLKFVLLNNINSSNLIKEYYGSKMIFDKKTGLYKIVEPKEIFFYLQGSMQYGRTTEFDQERIKWHFNKI